MQCDEDTGAKAPFPCLYAAGAIPGNVPGTVAVRLSSRGVPADTDLIARLLRSLIERPESDAGSTLPPTPEIPDHDILDLIGRGGMGTVYRAYHRALRSPVALKVLHPHLSEDPEFVERFEREAQIGASITHPNIVSYFGVGYAGGLHYISMELVDGMSVETLMEWTGALPPCMSMEIAWSIARALEYARVSGLIHCDVKPDNILVDRHSRALLADLGIARERTSPTDDWADDTRPILTLDYAPPEQIVGGVELDTRADVYSLGATLFHMITGRPPFASESRMRTIMGHLTADRPRISDIVGGVPPGTDEVIMLAMARNREDRYQTPGLLARDLRDILDGRNASIATAPDSDWNVMPTGQMAAFMEEGE